ncbi:membrane protein [Acinetobacter gyllenbergii]|uniref:DUF2167 domain-containing protein n=1 Tax=Acinetobacter gyllenbergii CIP 110306 = MTCC 11365 TaxID=1217657 RepID=A0A829HK79_9GAMM|nr:DUF2167 domain-containing protein [Acinetobacter gyllenbergii]EPF93005.1 hypothetical protein F957_00347 [Acinetobacter gyllenbergii CIP 110306 = MTCC 11365]EPH31315.1 hypothetical protein L293_2130 [Acinetobacter gyllenbergii CIP 110306 = MTCC 11365]ESK37028.1 hypothetical protein F987_03490 [Acinetobacter gyllenbergii NIPH 230]GMA10253.1 membrane protein [Acinetobacter gyllenbergii]
MLNPLHPKKLIPLSYAIALSLSVLGTTTIPSYVHASASTEETATNNTTTQNAAENPMATLDWHLGPKKENVANVATLNTLKDEGFLDPKNADKFLELTGNLTTGTTNILVAPDDSWWATFDFDPSGYVKDDEKIDADALLKQLKESDEPSNEERARLGYPKLYTVGWAVPPHYDNQTKRLEWALKIRDEENNEAINYTIRILGRTGVTSATLVSDEEHLTQNINAFKSSLKGFDYNFGEKYAEYREGDKVAEYGLAALIAGGAAVVATKKGFWAAIAAFFAAAWKFIAVGVVAVGGWLRSLFNKKKS